MSVHNEILGNSPEDKVPLIEHWESLYSPMLKYGSYRSRDLKLRHHERCVRERPGTGYSVPHYKTGFLIFGHLVDYLQNHACYKHTQYMKMITDLY